MVSPKQPFFWRTLSPFGATLVATLIVFGWPLDGWLAFGQEPVKAEAAAPPSNPGDRSHWAFRKPSRPRIPRVQEKQWVRNPVDSFILDRLEKAGLRPSKEAARAVLLRRVTFDLIGLPPTPAELANFLHDSRPDAYERVVDRLLASPHYGERWAQHWLDVAHYAESNGYELDAERPHAWHYRDYVIWSLNEDKPYDQFLTEQLAGDQLARGKEPRQCVDLLVATGFNRCGPIHLVSGNVDQAETRQELLTEMTGSVGSVFLGLTIGCARCHDHKFDPITQAEYYQLQAFFAAAKPREVDVAAEKERAAYERQVKELQARMAPLRKKVADLEAPYKTLLTEVKKAFLEPEYAQALEVPAAKRTPEQKKLAGHAGILIKVSWDEVVAALTPEERARRAAWRAQIHALEDQLPPPPSEAWAVGDDEKIPSTYILKRGDFKRKGKEVHPAFPDVLTDAPAKNSLDRLALARWLTTPDHPLTARVLVNRLWQHHFGRGLVTTPNDFGLRGQPPSHPELLDWLAVEFVDHGWSLKHIHRLLVLSSTYRQSSWSLAAHTGTKTNPENRLLWRMNRQRLEGEALRDSVLAVAGVLHAKMGGPMVRLPLEPEVLDLIFTEGEPDGVWRVTPDAGERRRRSIYLFNKRNVRLPLFEAFDQPDTLTSCPVRPVSTFAPQGLILLNGPFLQEWSKTFAIRLLRENGPALDPLINRAYLLALARQPREVEVRMARAFLNDQAKLIRERLRARERVAAPTGAPETVDPALVAAVVDFCLALLNRNEFLYVD